MPPNVSKKRDTKSPDYILRSGIAGGVAGCVAKTVVAPLDRVKILFQTSNPDFQKYAGTWRGAYLAGAEIYSQTGIHGLFQGHSATLLRIFPYAAIKYIAYDQVHNHLMPTRQNETNFKRFCAGAISGTISVWVTYPLELIRVRLAFITRSYERKNTNTHGALRKAISDIYHESSAYRPPPLSSITAAASAGVTSSNAKPASMSMSATASAHTSAVHPSSTAKALRAHLFYHFPILSFYRGFTVSLLGMVPYAGTSFLTWGYLRSRFLPHPTPANPKPKPTPLADLVIGAAAGSLSQTVSYPFEVIRRRMQVGGLTNPDPRAWLSIGEVVHRIWSTTGWRGFYVGLGIGYLKVVPMTATSYAVWQWGKRLLDL